MSPSRPAASLTALALAVAVAVAGCGRSAPHAAPAGHPAAVRRAASSPAKPASPAAHGLQAGAPTRGVTVPLPALPKVAGTSPLTVVPVRLTSALKPAPAPATPPATVSMPVPARLAGRFAAYRVGLPGGLTYLLAPKGMQGSGAIAADGSFHVTLAAPSRHEIVHIWSDGSCIPCSVQSASAFFASARRAAARYGGFHGQTLGQFGASVAHPDARTALFSYALASGVHVEGFAFYARSGSPRFLSEVVLAPAAAQGLTPWVLAAVRSRLR